jgi:Asp-tRNA(Asn)/Glu-tRNA(Gln) amidotransferase A subunit family amidase
VADLELAYTSATNLARMIREREISPVEVVRNALDRIDEVNPRLNCFCFVFPEDALAAARKAEQAVVDGAPLGPLHGVPIAFKDMTPTRGKRTTLGSYAFEHWVPDHDAVVVERLVGAGAIMMGKTTTSELAASGFTESLLWGITRNPWNPERTPGGSSGGSGVAVATGCVPFAEGCDMGGSVRIPSAFCGIIGLKPSLGRIPFDILPSTSDTYCHFGPLARTVDDIALFLASAQGQDDRDLMSVPGKIDLPAHVPAEVDGLRIALSPDLGYYAVDPQVVANLYAVADVLRARGAIVEEVPIGLTREVNDIGYEHWNVYIAAFAAPIVEKWGDRIHPLIHRIVADGLKVDGVTFKKLEFSRARLWNEFRKVFSTHDALLCPTMSIPAPRTGLTDLDFGTTDAEGRFHQYEMTFPFNVFSPCPAISVPSGFAEGLPTAAQIVGRPYQDLAVMRIAAAITEATGWAEQRPPCHNWSASN